MLWLTSSMAIKDGHKDGNMNFSHIQESIGTSLTSCGDFWAFWRLVNMVFLISTNLHEAQTNISEDTEPWTLPKLDFLGQISLHISGCENVWQNFIN